MGKNLSRQLLNAIENGELCIELQDALRDKDYKTVFDVLLSNNSHSDDKSLYISLVLHFCIKCKFRQQIQVVLKKTSKHLQKRHLNSLCMLASEEGCLSSVRVLCDYDANINAMSPNSYTALAYAVKYKHSDITAFLLSNGADCNVTDDHKNTALIHAIGNRNDASTVSLILDNKADVSLCNVRNRNALFYAVYENMIEVVRMLLARGANVNSADDQGTTALMVASFHGYVHITEVLVSKGAYVEMEDNEGFSALMCAVQNKQYSVIQPLVTHYDKVKSRNTHLMQALKYAVENDSSKTVKILLDVYNSITNPQLIQLLTLALEHASGKDVVKSVVSQFKDLLFYAASNPRHEAVLKLLIDNEIPMDYFDSQGNSVLIYAVAIGSLTMLNDLLRANVSDIKTKNLYQQDALLFSVSVDDVAKAEALIRCNADVNSVEENGYTPLMCATLRGSIAMCRLLMKHGADVNMEEVEGFTALMAASQNNHVEVVKELLVHEVEIQKKNVYGHDALFKAVQNNNHEVVSVLLQHGASVNSVDNCENTPLIESCRVSGSITTLEMLLDAGADVNDPGEYKLTAVMWACKTGSTEITKLLLSRGANLELIDDSSRDAFHIAVYHGHVDIAEIILQQSRECLDRKDNRSNTPLITACYRENVECVKMLLQNGASIQSVNKKGYTAIMFAIQLGNDRLVKMLLDELNYLYEIGMCTDSDYQSHTDNPFTNGINLISFAAYKEQHHLISMLSFSKDDRKHNFVHQSENYVDVYACAGLSENAEVLTNVLDNDPNVVCRPDTIDQLVKAFEDSCAANDIESLVVLDRTSHIKVSPVLKAVGCAAAKRDSVRIVKALLQLPNCRNDEKFISLIMLISCLYGSESVMTLLVNMSANVKLTFAPRRETPLALALMFRPDNATNIISILAPVSDLSKCFSLAISDQYPVDVTILMFASLTGNIAAVSSLLKHGASVDQTTVFGLGAVHFCLFGRRGMKCPESNSHEVDSVVSSNSLLRSSLNSRSWSEDEFKGIYCDILEMLMAKCSDITDMRTEDGINLISWAQHFNLEDCVKIILTYHHDSRLDVDQLSPGDKFHEMIPAIVSQMMGLLKHIDCNNKPGLYDQQHSFAERLSETCSTLTDAFQNINNMDEPFSFFESLVDADDVPEMLPTDTRIEVSPFGLYKLAEKIEAENCLNKVATFLGVTCDKIIVTQEENNDSIEASYQILRYWYESLTTGDRRRVFSLLSDALNKSGLNEIARNLGELFTERRQLSSYKKMKRKCKSKLRRKSESELHKNLHRLEESLELPDVFEDEPQTSTGIDRRKPIKVIGESVTNDKLFVELTAGHEQTIFKNRAKLSGNLALEDVDLKAVERRCNNKPSLFAVELLRKWLFKWGGGATVNRLINAFEDSGLHHVTNNIKVIRGTRSTIRQACSTL